ncbi:hypothetical protein [Flavilitoribacter nigricans]|uniref:Uncharacterized protein n=1 Tax=Flavilitoribacter nigricans (strain ATCC 23147 / DSM 23189 / NBRC 102662 / NCIMB 1420 / SS-2) TaxID=1122177 RepID=A0A2D0N4U0_FLAN2|nr:hypothetical protein [Flavilitoribacter nigricans]PHN02803.1 hypothetical protein CRP01_29925 [Flavilitoribacter nigricans DSM 23189 = NBRC 102662]
MLNFSINRFNKLVFSCLFALILTACTDSQNTVDENTGADPTLSETEITASEEVGDLDFRTFANQEYSFSTEIPEAWTESTNQLGEGLPVINFVPQSKAAETDLPISMQTATSLSHIDVHPKGHDSGYPIGKNHRLALYEGTVPASSIWDHERSRVYVLGNGEVWAYLLYPKSTPTGWEEDGFIFAQIAIENFSSECFDDITNQSKSMEKCKPLEGDEVLYYGRVNAEDQAYVKHALQSLELRS